MSTAESPTEPILRCRFCGSYGTHLFLEDRDTGLDRCVEWRCESCGEYAPHDVLRGIEGYRSHIELECPDCDYETLWFEPFTLNDDGLTDIPCPECPREPSDELRTLSGVGTTKANELIAAGYESVDAVRNATQDELAEVEGIGNALAARILASVDDAKSTHDWHLTKLSVSGEQWVIEAATDDDSSG